MKVSIKYVCVILFFFTNTAGFAQTEQKVDSIQSLLVGTDVVEEKANYNLELGKLVYAKELERAMSFARNAIRLSTSNELITGLSRGYQLLGIFHYFKQDYDSAVFFAELSSKYYLADNDSNGYAAIQNLLGNINVSQFKYAKGIEHLRIAENVFLQQGDSASLASVLANIGLIYYQDDKYKDALNIYFRSMAIHRSSNNLLGMAKSMNNIAIIYLNNYNYNESLKYFLETKKYYIELEDQEQLLQANLNIVKVYNALRKFKKSIELLNKGFESIKLLEERPKLLLEYSGELAATNFGLSELPMAKVYLEKALAMAIEQQDTSNIITFIGLKNQIYLKGDNLDSSKILFKWADILLANYNDQSGLSSYQIEKAQFLNENGRCKEAKTLILKAINFYKAKKRYKNLDEALGVLAKSELGLKDYYSLSKTNEERLAIKDSFFNSQELWNLAQLDVKKDFAEKQVKDSLNTVYLRREKNTQIALEQSKLKQQKTISYASIGGGLLVLLLAGSFYNSRQKTRKQNKEIQAKNIDIEKRNTQIEWLLKEIHHRVKNNLQIVSSLMSIQGRSLNDEKSKALIRESQNRIKSMSLVHESLYQAEDLSQIEIEPFIKRIAESVKSSLKSKEQEINLQIDADNFEMNAEQAVPVGIIINELASNAFKHAFKNRSIGTLKIAVKNVNDSLTLLIDDDGPELPSDFEVDFTGGSIGMALVQSLAEDQLGGRFTIGEKDNKFKVEFPILKAS
jgi:two-component sensor histidine kinase